MKAVSYDIDDDQYTLVLTIAVYESLLTLVLSCLVQRLRESRLIDVDQEPLVDASGTDDHVAHPRTIAR